MNPVNPHAATYRSFLLRLWRDTGESHWRASLQSTATEQTYHFDSVEALYVFIITRLSRPDGMMESRYDIDG